MPSEDIYAEIVEKIRNENKLPPEEVNKILEPHKSRIIAENSTAPEIETTVRNALHAHYLKDLINFIKNINEKTNVFYQKAIDACGSTKQDLYEYDHEEKTFTKTNKDVSQCDKTLFGLHNLIEISMKTYRNALENKFYDPVEGVTRKLTIPVIFEAKRYLTKFLELYEPGIKINVNQLKVPRFGRIPFAIIIVIVLLILITFFFIWITPRLSIKILN